MHEDFFKVFPGLTRAYGQFFITERKGPKLDGYGKTIRESYTRLLKVNNTETEEDIDKDKRPESTFFKNPDYKNVST